MALVAPSSRISQRAVDLNSTAKSTSVTFLTFDPRQAHAARGPACALSELEPGAGAAIVSARRPPEARPSPLPSQDMSSTRAW